MPGPYNPPNPYGSYFSFGAPESMTRQTYGPMPFGMMSPGAAAMAGAGSGGFNPTPSEYLSGMIRQQYQQRFMAELMRSDPRAQNITTMLLNQMSESSQKSTLNLFGGRANMQEMVGMAMSMPGIASMVGGSSVSIGQGAYAAMSSGMKLNGYRTYDGGAAMLGATAMVNQITKQFYFQGGGANLAATSGLNRDQIGGIMMLGAAQGAFSGMNLGELVQKGNRLSVNLDQGTMNKISQFTKTAAKALSSLIDVYGSGSIVELAAKANQITGLNLDRLGNAGLIGNRLDALRRGGAINGIDTGTMFDLASWSTQMGRSMGLAGEFAGNVGGAAAINAAAVFRANQSQAGSFRTATYSLQEIAGGMVRDQAGMMMDPVGRRRTALQLGLETGHFTGSAAAEARRLMREDGAGAMGRIDQFMRAQGIATDSYIKLMGGPEGMQRMLSDAGQTEVSGLNAETVGQRARATLRRQAVRTFGRGIVGAGGKAMMGLIEGIDKTTLEKIFEGASGGDFSNTEKLLMNDPAGRLNPSGYLEMVKAAVTGPGGFGERAASMHKSLQQAISANPFLSKSFMTESGKMDLANRRMGILDFGAENRGAMMGGKFIEGLLSKLSGDDPKTSFAKAMSMYPENIIGRNKSIYMPVAGKFEEGKMRSTISAFVSGMSGTDVGRRALGILGLSEGTDADQMSPKAVAEFSGKLLNPITRYDALKEYQMAKFGDSYLMQSNLRVNRAQLVQGTVAAANKMMDLMGPGEMRSAMLGNLSTMLKDPNRADADKILSEMVKRTSDIPRLAEWAESGDLKKLAAASPLWATGISSYLDQQGEGATQRQDATLLEKIKKIKDNLGAAGRESGAQAMVLTGQLDLVGNALKLVGALNDSEVKK